MNKKREIVSIFGGSAVIEALKRRIKELEKVVERSNQVENAGVQGRLRVRKVKESFQYYHVKEKCDSKGEYIKKSERSLATKLAYKQYYSTIGKVAKKELNQLNYILSIYNPNMLIETYNNMHEGRKTLIKPVEMDNRDYADMWQAMTYDRKPIDLNRAVQQTIKGEIVRSKSEALIADTLYAMGIPYHYEMPLYLEGIGVIYPDFTVLNIEKRKVFYLEHLGMIDERGYLRDAVERLDGYEKNEIYPGESLLLTYETEKRPLKRDELKKMLGHYLQ
ncbi:MAG: hypothetical protein KBS96_03545 [Lachnospiraceae bacterium]|nr:hypothetical protein [Candidatus Colinaster scatohippi]